MLKYIFNRTFAINKFTEIHYAVTLLINCFLLDYNFLVKINISSFISNVFLKYQSNGK